MNLFEELTGIKQELDNLIRFVSRYEPVGFREGTITLTFGKDEYTVEVVSNILYNGSNKWINKVLERLIKKVKLEVSQRVADEMSFPRNFLVDIGE